MKLTAILAIDEAGGLGFQGQMPWPRIPRDMKRFRDATLGKPCIVGRVTYQTLPPLPGRDLIVLGGQSSPAGPASSNVWYARSLEEAYVLCAYRLDAEEAVVIGGAKVYRSTRSYCHKILLTEVAGTYQADAKLFDEVYSREAWFSGLSCDDWSEHPADDKNPVGVKFSTWTNTEFSGLRHR